MHTENKDSRSSLQSGFAPDFIWGAASASYQIEGAHDADGKGPSIWDVFSHTPGKTNNGDTGDTATDAYNRYPEDIRAMKEMGLDAYRFSLSWPRIQPAGRGPVNEAGLAYYDRVVDALLEAGITPYVTLFHWDLPQALQDEGGWENRATAEAFGEFARIVGQRFRGRVKHYFTVNEPQIFIGMGYGSGVHAPGLKIDTLRLQKAMHNALLAHGLAVRALRESSEPGTLIGIASTGKLCYPSEPAAGEAARGACFAIDEETWTFSHNYFLDPCLKGHYPEEMPGSLRSFTESVDPADFGIIGQPLDFIGINVYNGHEIDADGNYVDRYTGFPRTALKWPVTPEVMNKGIQYVWDRYGLPVYITENGQSCNDKIFLDGKVHDPDRIDFLHRYLRELRNAAEAGVPLRGYFHWSLCDNFEWHSGYDDRFGIVYVDYRDQRRILKDSALWYRDVAASNGKNL